MRKLKYNAVRWSRILALVLVDTLILNAAALLSLLTRFELSVSTLTDSGYAEMYLQIAWVYTPVALIIFACFRLYRSLWEYASVEELSLIVYAALLTDVALVLIQLPFGLRLLRLISLRLRAPKTKEDILL